MPTPMIVQTSGAMCKLYTAGMDLHYYSTAAKGGSAWKLSGWMFLKFSKTKVLPFGVPCFGIPAANGCHVFMEGDRIDEAVLALLYLGMHKRHNTMAGARTWKSFGWGAMGRLHRKGLITDPVAKAKSVLLTESGLREAEAAFRRLFESEDEDTDP